MRGADSDRRREKEDEVNQDGVLGGVVNVAFTGGLEEYSLQPEVF